MKDYISVKTKFINKLYNKFHKIPDLEKKLLARNKKIYDGHMGHGFDANMIYKYKYFIFEGKPSLAKAVFWRFFCIGKQIKKSQLLKNFEIETYKDNESFKSKKNTEDTVYINKYFIAFFNFYIESGHMFEKLSRVNKKSFEDSIKPEKIAMDILKNF